MSQFQIIACPDKLIVDIFCDTYALKRLIPNFNNCRVYTFQSTDILKIKELLNYENFIELPVYFHDLRYSLMPCRMNAYLIREIILMEIDD